MTSVVSDSGTPTDCSPSDSSVHGILQPRILEWGATPSSSQGLSRPRDRTQVPYVSTTWEAQVSGIRINWFLFLFHFAKANVGLPRWFSGKEPACQCRRCRFNPWAGKIPWRRKWQPAPVLLTGESHGQRNLAGYSPWGCKESDTHSRKANVKWVY